MLNTLPGLSPLGTYMLAEITDIVGCEVYTPSAVYVGSVKDVVLDLQGKRIDGLFIDRPNPTLVEGSVSINIPFRWVSSAGDIVVLRYFPGFIRTGVKGPVDDDAEGISETLG